MRAVPEALVNHSTKVSNTTCQRYGVKSKGQDGQSEGAESQRAAQAGTVNREHHWHGGGGGARQLLGCTGCAEVDFNQGG